MLSAFAVPKFHPPLILSTSSSDNASGIVNFLFSVITFILLFHYTHESDTGVRFCSSVHLLLKIRSHEYIEAFFPHAAGTACIYGSEITAWILYGSVHRLGPAGGQPRVHRLKDLCISFLFRH